MSKTNDFVKVGIGILFGLFVVVAICYYIAIGLNGIEYRFGKIYMYIALILCLVLRFFLPISIGIFFCALDLWHWHWIFALLLAAPGFVLVIPGLTLFLIMQTKNMIFPRKI